jgi:hypothetical protein
MEDLQGLSNHLDWNGYPNAQYSLGKITFSHRLEVLPSNPDAELLTSTMQGRGSIQGYLKESL